MEKKRRPWLAFLLSLPLPGLGHLYVGLPAAAVIAWAIVVTLVFVSRWFFFGSFVGFVVFAIAAIVVRLAVGVDAAVRARQTGVAALRWFQRWYLYPLVWIAALAVSTFVLPPLMNAVTRYQGYKIPSGGMDPALEVGDYLMVDMWHYSRNEPQRGDIVVFLYPEDPRRDFIKRCVALPGDTIEIRDKQVIVNGRPLSEAYVVFRDRTVYGAEEPSSRGKRDQMEPYTVPTDSIFCLGDNRDNSLDSRFWGTVPYVYLRGKARYLYWSKDLARVSDSFGMPDA